MRLLGSEFPCHFNITGKCANKGLKGCAGRVPSLAMDDSSTTTMTDIPISLQASMKVDPDRDSLPFLITQINAQRGSFRNITEESLEEEIRNAGESQLYLSKDIAADEEPQNVKSRHEELAEARLEMLTQIQ